MDSSLIRRYFCIRSKCISFLFLTCIISFGFCFFTITSIQAIEPSTDSIINDFHYFDPEALRAAITDLMQSYPGTYTHGPEYLQRLTHLEARIPVIREGLKTGDSQAIAEAKSLIRLQQEALLTNPLLDFNQLLLIKRKPIGDPRRAIGDPENDKGVGKFIGLPQQSSWQLHTMPNPTGWENEIVTLSPIRPDGALTTLFQSQNQELVCEMDLNFDADKLTFSMPDQTRHWQIFELYMQNHQVHQVSPTDQPDVHNLDSCYLPNGKIAFISTAPFQGVPCNSGVNVGMTYIMDGDGQNVRQLCFEQDHNFCPTVMNDGRILYLRWEYTDIPHVWARFLFTMNPDGTGQREFYGSGGYWPNAIFWARPIPNHPSKFVGIVTGHHVGRVGELIVFDPAKGRRSTDGVVQRIPSDGKTVQPLIQDKLTLDSWPKFLYPYPLSEKYFLVACKPSPRDLWGIYLVDTFNNIVLVKELEGYALLEPIPLHKTPKPPVIADRVDLSREDSLVYIENIYKGPGLDGIPPGSVKNLRLYTYHFAYRTIAGINHRVGADGPWEPKRILGTVPVAKDGSAYFRVPANTPISIQPLDEQGRALQLMRSWMTAMPGELVSCVGCHEKQNGAPPNIKNIAFRSDPSEIEPWHGPARGFSFMHEVQPVLDRYCVGCHNGSQRQDGQQIPDLRRDQGKLICYANGNPQAKVISDIPREELVTRYGGVFDPSYIELRRMVRVGGLESDLRQLNPGEFNADTTELIQMLEKGHHGVTLDEEAWNRLTTWIDLNAPCHGTWHEIVGQKKLQNDHQRRLDLRAIYGGDTEDPEEYQTITEAPIIPILPEKPNPQVIPAVYEKGWPWTAAQASQIQAKYGKTKKVLDLGNGVKLPMVLIPAGEFVMGDAQGKADEKPQTIVKIEKPFWMSATEITNEQYNRFDPLHDSRYEHKGSWQFNEWDRGWPLNRPKQPVVRVSEEQAQAFCQWLSTQTKTMVNLPTEAQWEYACRAGSDTPFFYGTLNTDFSKFANMADWTIRDLAYDVRDQNPPDLVPRDARFNDHTLVTADVASFNANPWGLYDMHGNVWEWTRSIYKPYPYKDDGGQNKIENTSKVVVRGGSWYDRPKRCRSSFRLTYPAWQRVYNVGFRIVMEANDTGQLTAQR